MIDLTNSVTWDPDYIAIKRINAEIASSVKSIIYHRSRRQFAAEHPSLMQFNLENILLIGFAR